MHRANYWRRILDSPGWLWQRVILLRILPQKMLDWTWYLLHLSWMSEKIHFIIPLSYFVRYTAGPSLNLVEFMLLFVVTCLAHVHFFVRWKASRSSLVVTGKKHNEASIDYFVNLMISVLASLNNFVLKEMLLVSMNCLFWSVIPASIDPFVSLPVLPGTIYLSNYRFCDVVWILKVNPVA